MTMLYGHIIRDVVLSVRSERKKLFSRMAGILVTDTSMLRPKELAKTKYGDHKECDRPISI